MRRDFREVCCIDRIKLGFDLFVIAFQSSIEPHNAEQEITNVQVLQERNTFYFGIPCSTFDIQKAAKFF